MGLGQHSWNPSIASGESGSKGDLTLDDTVIPKPFATPTDRWAWVFSSQERRPIYGFSLVLRVSSDGTLRIPLRLRLWRKGPPRNTSCFWNG
jgi:hypothetical protein